jgi:AraC-like DNA-binding protein
MTNFHIPENTPVPCITNPQVFFHNDLEVDTQSPEWRTSTLNQKAARITAQEAAEREAVNLCIVCPLFTECNQWAQGTHSSIFGVVGGLVPEERRTPNTAIYVLDNERDHRGRVRVDVVHRLLRLGKTHQQIADDLNCSSRTIARISQQQPQKSNLEEIAAPSPVQREHKKATKTIDTSALTHETQRIYEYLTHGQWNAREELLTELLNIVPQEAAHKFAPPNRFYSSETDRYKAGARRFLLNRLDIAQRRGRIIKHTTEDGEVMIRVSEAVALALVQV